MSEQVMFHLTEYGIDREKLEEMREFLLED